MKGCEGYLGGILYGMVAIAVGVFLLRLGWHIHNLLLVTISIIIMAMGAGLSLLPLIIDLKNDNKKRWSGIKPEDIINFRKAVCEEYEELIQCYEMSVHAVKDTWIFFVFSTKLIISLSICDMLNVRTEIWFLSHDNKWLRADMSHLARPQKFIACKNKIELKNAILADIQNQATIIKLHAEKLFADKHGYCNISSVSSYGIYSHHVNELNFRGTMEINKILAEPPGKIAKEQNNKE